MRYADANCRCTEVFEDGQQFYVFTGPSYSGGEPHSVKIPAKALHAYRDGALIQNAMPMLSADDREFLISGITPDDWDTMMGESGD